MNHLHLERARQLQAAARRRADLERWHESLRMVQAVKPRSPDEAIAKHEALELLHQARPN